MNTETRVGLFIIIGVGIFLYLSIHIGDIKLNRNEYSLYSAYFDETGGIEGKSPVKMAGVSVGWVDAINLLSGGKVEIKMRVKSIHKLGKNAFVRISQEGLIGTKTIEIDPGDSSSGYLAPGSTLPMPGRAPTTVSGLLEHFKDISTNIGDVTSSMKGLLTSADAEDKIKGTLNNAHQTSKNIASATHHANHLLESQTEHIQQSIQNVKEVTDSLRETVPGITTTAQNIMQNADDAMLQAKDVLRGTDEVVEKINNGEGLISKLINEGELYKDIKKTVQGVKNYIHKTQSIRIKVDGHLESMLDKSDRKGYAAINIFPYSDYFYSIQMISGKIGKFERRTIDTKYYDRLGNEILLPTVPELPNFPSTSPFTVAAYAARTNHTSYTPSKPLFSLLIGKKFTNLTFKGGLMEDTFGLGIDYEIPTGSNRFSWTTTIEAFDFNGHNRSNGDNRMHVKWLNRISYMDMIYTVFGFDDIFGKSTTTPFVGIGICFNDDDLKYFLPGLSSLK